MEQKNRPPGLDRKAGLDVEASTAALFEDVTKSPDGITKNSYVVSLYPLVSLTP
jgi:hypothetical protein